jgi:uncharacterized protein (DUF2235 family)
VRQLRGHLLDWLRRGRKIETQMPPRVARGATTHVILIDGTMSSLEPGDETNIGQIYRLLKSAPQTSPMAIYYEAGVQWQMWREIVDVAMGRGIDDQILRAYGWLATRYKPGDRIFLMGFSRGAFAVRSLAGIIDRVGLLKAHDATERNIRLAYRYYMAPEVRTGQRVFRDRFCHSEVMVEMIGVFDTVKALGLRLPFLWMLTEPKHRFHDQALSRVVRRGFQAIALDETRVVFDPILWQTDAVWQGRVEQVWFLGAHGDIGGHLGGFAAARPLANIPLVWMLERALSCGLALPDGWRTRFPADASASSVGTTRGWGKAFLFRARRRIGVDMSESLHPTAAASRRGRDMIGVAQAGKPT